MKKIILLVLSLFLIGSHVALAQRAVRGTVISAEDNRGIPGAAVMVKGTTIGTTTDFDGEFTLNVPADAKTLTVSYLGMNSQDVAISSSIRVVLSPASVDLKEVVISGYGVRKKAAFTGSAAQVGEEVVKKQTESNVINSLQGSIAGLQISSSTGQPGAPTVARIRGNSSVSSGNAPLYVIDGVPVASGSYGMYSYTDPLSSINPDDIENISVLKDASATSIYGSRASNGVIVITTKKGKSGDKTSLNFGAKVGVSQAPYINRNFRKLGLEDYKTFLLTQYRNADAISQVPTRSDAYYLSQLPKVDANIDFSRPGTNWWDEVTRLGLIQEYSLTASGGNDKTKFFLSGGYFDNKGFVIGTDFRRYSARINVDNKPTKYLTLGLNMSGAYAEVNSVPTELAYASPIWAASRMRPTDPVYDPVSGGWFTGYNSGYNPVALYQDENRNRAFQQQYKALLAPYIQVQFWKNVFFQTKLGVDFTTVKENNYWSSSVDPQGKSLEGLSQLQDETSSITTITNTLNWLPTVAEKHNFNVLVGQEAQRFSDFYSYLNGLGYPYYTLREIASASETEASSGSSAAALSSLFGNLEYDYADKYYISGSVRRDGSSRFGENNRHGVFFSVGAKYRISAENFLATASQSWLNNLTLRLSYGTTGNQNVSYYEALSYYGTNRYADISGLYPGSLGNPELGWESRNKFNVGIDFSIFNRFTLEVDYYYDVTNDLIFGRPLSAGTGFSSMVSNVGKLRNTGIEFQLNTLLVNQKNFKWTFALNFTSNDNKLLKLASDKPIVGSISWMKEGLPASSFYVQEWAGVDPATGRPRWYGQDGEYVYNFNEAVKRDLGSAFAKFYGGFSTRLDFYNFDLNVQFNYNYGNKIFVNDVRYLEHIGEEGTSSTTYHVLDNAWQKPGDIADVPRIVRNGNNGSNNWSSRYLLDGSYLRLKSVMLGYTLPRKHAEKIYLSSFRAFFSCDNVFTVTHKNFRGYDPEAGLSGSQAANYPVPVNYTIGVNIGF